jgi:hypothetical protein
VQGGEKWRIGLECIRILGKDENSLLGLTRER